MGNNQTIVLIVQLYKLTVSGTIFYGLVVNICINYSVVRVNCIWDYILWFGSEHLY